jgi:hypothetical protein
LPATAASKILSSSESSSITGSSIEFNGSILIYPDFL